MGDEKRTFSRVETGVRVYMRRVPEDSGFATGFDCPGCDTETSDALKKSSLPEGVTDFLLELNRKMDILISLSSRKMIQDDYPIQGSVSEISGAGVKCHVRERFSPGDHVEIVLVLSAFPLRMASAIARVVRLERGGQDPIWAMEFTRVRDPDLEQIVQFVFKEQRARIREQKWADR